MNGIILIDKPLGKTSHDMVYFIRRLVGIKKVGHTGTLDPNASGVLPVCIGKATKACDMLTASQKEYLARMTLGKTTDTQDASGEVLTSTEVNVSNEEIINTVNSFIGEIDQIPPMFSAIKKNGKKLYELARQGVVVEREARRVNIYSIDVLDIDNELHTVDIKVSCSKGTYIRTLCEDIGNALGCGAYMSQLRRTKSGGFDISECKTCEELLKLKEEGRLDEAIIATDEVFKQYDSITLDDFLSKKLKNGIRIRKKGLTNGEIYRVYDQDNFFMALCRYSEGELCILKTFWS